MLWSMNKHLIYIVMGGLLVFVPRSLGQDLPLYGVAQRVAAGLSRPVFATSPPGDLNRMFIVEQRGAIKILDLNTGVVSGTLFLNVTGLATGNEQGLLGMAFHPDYASNGLFYINVTVVGGDTQIREYKVSSDPAVADPGSARMILTFNQPFSNHNGGWIGFGPNDGYLYIATGDGGSGGDPQNNANDITGNLLGKLLRIDVDGDHFPADPLRNYAIPASNPFVGVTGDDEIWAYGLRNPWRCSFDRLTGDLYIGDVGQNQREEIDIQPAGSAGGENYGWRMMEGFNCFDNSQAGGNPPCFDPSLTPPVYDYPHNSGNFGGFSVTGGYVYRGTALRSCMQGTYFFADNVINNIWSIDTPDPNDAPATVVRRNGDLPPDIGQANSVSSFAEDEAGELYIISLNGRIYRIVPANPPAPGDFDGDGLVAFGDLVGLADCLAGPDAAPQPGRAVCLDNCLDAFDTNADADVDLADVVGLQKLVTP